MTFQNSGIKMYEQRITQVIHLKHTLELVHTLKQALASSSNTMFETFATSLDDPRFQEMLDYIVQVVTDDTRYQKGNLNMKHQVGITNQLPHNDITLNQLQF